MKELLKNAGLEDNQIQSILSAMKQAEIYTSKNENIDERYTKLKTQKADLEKQVQERDVQLAELSENNKDNKDLLAQIEQLQSLNKQTKQDYENKIAKMEFDNALNEALNNANCKNNKALKGLLDIDSIKYQEGKLEGLEGQLEALKESDSYLFNIDKASSTGSVGNFARASKKVVTKEEFNKMNYRERNNLYKENKDLYLELSK